MPNIYLTEADRVARTAFSMWDRDPASPSFGSFDRQHWGWKFKDFSDATLQYAVKLAVGYAERSGETSVLTPLLEAYVDYCRRIQHSDGSFDQCYPFERTPGVVYDILTTLIFLRRSPHLPERSASMLDDVMTRAVDFSLRTDEKHGEIANHIAEFAYELLEYAQFSGNERARKRGESYVERLLSLFDRQEGWFREYNGPDAGYQTRTMRYVVKCAALPGNDSLWQIAEKAAGFLDGVLMPDGSAHPMLGVRSTALVYPSSFEILANRNPRLRALADRVRFAWENGRVPRPSEIDFQNAIRLADDAADAARILASNAKPAAMPVPQASEALHLPNAGLIVRRSPRSVVAIGYKLGGAVVAYTRSTDSWKLTFEDAGYVIRSERSRPLLSRVPDGGKLAGLAGDRVAVDADFYESLHEDVTPLQFVALRVLNYTVLRVQFIADLFRRVVVHRLMSRRPKSRVKLRREIDASADSLRIADTVSGSVPRDATIYRVRRATGVHMASSRYFQADEIRRLPTEWMEKVTTEPDAAGTLRLERRVDLKNAPLQREERDAVDAAGA